jgi:uncharacterized protein involved in outer membrane biogenesis
MRRIILWIAGVGLGVLALVLFTLALIIPSLVLQRLATSVQSRYGLVAEVEGGAQLSFSDGLAVALSGITITRPGASGVPLLTAPLIRVPLSLDTIFASDPTRQMIVEDAVITLAEDEPGAPPAARAAGTTAKAVKPFDIRLENASLKATGFGASTGSGASLAVTGLSGTIVQDGDGSLQARLRGLFNGADTGFEISVDDAARFRGQGSPADITISAGHASIAMTGLLGLSKGLAFDGSLSADAPDSKKFLAWLGLPLQGLKDNLAFGADAGVSLSGTAVALSDLALGLGPLTVKGKLALETSGERPMLNADLSADRLTTAIYGAATPDAVPDLNSDWREAPFDLSDLKRINATVKMSAATCICAGIETGPATLSAQLQSGALTAALVAAPQSGGDVSVDLALSSDADPALGLKLKATDVRAEDLLAKAFGVSFLQGPIALDADLTSGGASAAEMMSRLAGQASVSLKDGTLRGVDLAQAVGLAGEDSREGWGGSADQALSLPAAGTATARFADGIASLSDTRLESEGVKLAISGEVDLLRRAVNLMAKPEGKAARLPLGIRIKGPWDNPKVSAKLDTGDGSVNDLLDAAAAVAADPALAKDASKAAKKILKSLTGN